MQVVSFLSYGGSEAIVLSHRRMHERKLDWTSGQILFDILSAFPYLYFASRSLTFRQNDKESIGVAWDRSALLAQSGPDLSLPDHLLLQHFYAGLDKESAHHLDFTSGGSIAHLTPTEGKEVLNKIMDRTSFLCMRESPPVDPMVGQEEVTVAKSNPQKANQ